MLRGLFAKRQDRSGSDRIAGRRDAAAEVKTMVRATFGLEDSTGLTVSEIECLDPSCPGIETVILILPEGGKVRAVKIGKPIGEITEQDVGEVFAMQEAAR